MNAGPFSAVRGNALYWVSYSNTFRNVCSLLLSAVTLSVEFGPRNTWRIFGGYHDPGVRPLAVNGATDGFLCNVLDICIGILGPPYIEC